MRRIIATILNPLGSENLLFWEPKLLFVVKLKDLTEVRMMISFAMRLFLVSLDEWLRSDRTEVVTIAFAVGPLLVSLQRSRSD